MPKKPERIDWTAGIVNGLLSLLALGFDRIGGELLDRRRSPFRNKKGRK